MPLSGVNKLCKQCIGTCKQWEQVRIIACPMFHSKHPKDAKSINRGDLRSQQNA